MVDIYPNLSQGISTFPQLIQKANEVSGGYGSTFPLLGYMTLIIITVVAFIALKDYPVKESAPATMFISFITSVFLSVGLGLIPDSIPIIPLLGLVISIAMLFFEKE